MEHKAAGKTQNLARAVLLAAYCVLLALLVSHHENWRDEAQAWLLARDLGFFGLVRQMAYEGHPCLWHLLIMPLTRLNLPYVSINVLSCALTVCAAALLLWKSPLPALLKIAVLIGAPFLYQLPVIARSYSLIAPILFWNATVYPSRRQRPLVYGLTIALLVQTHIMMLAMAGALSMIWLGESLAAFRRDRDGRALARQAAGLCLPLASLVFLLIQLSGVSNSSAFHSTLKPSVLLLRIGRALRKALDFGGKWATLAVLLVFAAAMAAFFLWALKRGEALKTTLVFALGWCAMIVLLAVTDRVDTQKMAVLAPLLVWLLWLNWNGASGRLPRTSMALAALAVFIPMIWQNASTTLVDWRVPYSDSHTCAEFLEQNVPADGVIMVTNDAYGSALLPYMTRKTLASAKSGTQISYAGWKRAGYLIQSMDDLYGWLRENHPEIESAWLVEKCSRPPLSSERGMEIIYESENAVRETYRVYRLDMQ